jgi:hypothetical protein
LGLLALVLPTNASRFVGRRRGVATHAKALGPDLDRVVGTALDKGAELEALAAMPAPGQSIDCEVIVTGEAPETSPLS